MNIRNIIFNAVALGLLSLFCSGCQVTSGSYHEVSKYTLANAGRNYYGDMLYPLVETTRLFYVMDEYLALDQEQRQSGNYSGFTGRFWVNEAGNCFRVENIGTFLTDGKSLTEAGAVWKFSGDRNEGYEIIVDSEDPTCAKIKVISLGYGYYGSGASVNSDSIATIRKLASTNEGWSRYSITFSNMCKANDANHYENFLVNINECIFPHEYRSGNNPINIRGEALLEFIRGNMVIDWCKMDFNGPCENNVYSGSSTIRFTTSRD